MQTFLHYRWSVPSTLHRLHLRRIIPLLLLALCVTGAKAQSDVKFNDGVRYSQWVIDSRMNNFYANTTECGFAVYNQKGTQTSGRKDGKTSLDYVVGLVAKSIIEASQYYSQYDWAKSFAKPWFLSIKDYGDNFYNKFRSTSGSLDDLNAVKLFIPLRALTETKGKYPDATTHANTATALNTALSGLGTHNSSYSIKSGTTAEKAGKTVAGGWWHKKDYEDQMWLDGSYMGPALLAELVNYSGTTNNIDTTDDWDLIVKQFTILRSMCWNETDKLLYHAFAADGGTNSTSHSDTWAGLSSKDPYVFHSETYWGRAVGWYFLALVDVLEQMEKANISSSDTKFTTLKGYLTETAEGLKARQDASGGWYQILDKNSTYSASEYNDGKKHSATSNYIESSATALFTAAYLKAIRKGYLDGTTYKTVAEDGYKCLVNNFFSVDANGKVNIFGSCRSAGLGGSGDLYKAGAERFRDGSNAYYLLGYDVAKVEKNENKTEGKVLGAFIMAATEYERAPENQKDIRFSYDLAPTYTLAKGDDLKVEALGSGAETATYQWYMTDGTTSTAVKDATSATFYPTASGSYYCKATSGSTTIQTSTTEVTVEGTDGIENGGSNGEKVLFSTDFTETAWEGVTTTSTNPTATVTIGGTQVTLKGHSTTGFSVSDGILTFPGNNMSNNDNYYIAIPVSGVNGSITIEFGGTMGYKYFYDICASGVKPTREETNKVANGTVSVTEPYSGTEAVIYIGQQSGNYKTISSIKITTPSSSSSGTPSSDASATFTYNDAALSFTDNTATINLASTQAGSTITVNATPAAGATITTTSENTTILDNVISITAPAAGTSASYTYTVKAADNTTTKDYTINVSVASTGDGEAGGSVTGEVVYFETKDSNVSTNTSVVNASGASTTTGSVIYNDTKYTNGVKLQTDKVVNLTLASSCSVTLVFRTNDATNSVTVGTNTYTVESDGTIKISELTAGTYEIKKKSGESHLYAVDIQPTGPSLSFTTQPSNKDYAQGVSVKLTVAASVSNDTNREYGNVTYLWYSNTTESNQNGTLLEGETKATYSPSTAELGTKYYYCVATAAKTADASQKLTATSNVAVVTVSKPSIEFTTQPQGAVYKVSASDVAALTVAATTNFKGTVTYQWYSNTKGKIPTTAEGLEAQIMSGAATSSHKPSITTTGKTYYYCIASSTYDSKDYTAISDLVCVEVVTALYSYNVQGKTTPKCNESRSIVDDNDKTLVKFTFGGWKYNNNRYLKPNAENIDANYITDEWVGPATQDVNALDGYQYAISGKNDAVQENKAEETTMYKKTRYGWFQSPTRNTDGVTTDSHPYTLPVRGAYMTFEPTQNGTLTIYLLQNGAWNSDKNNNKDIIPGEFRMHAFQITNQRGLVLAEFAPQYKITVNQKVKDGYTCSQYEKDPGTGNYDKTSKDISNWEEFWALTYDERKAVHDNWSNGTNGSQTIIKLKDGSFLAIQKAIVKYEFHVTGNETYYLFSNFSKLGFSGATFQPDAAQPTDDTTFSGAKSLDETKPYTKITPTADGTIGETGLTNYTFTIDGKEVGKVSGVFIPQFKEITLKRTFKKDQWNTLSLPFNLTQSEVEEIFGHGTEILVFKDAITTNVTKLHIKFIYHEIQNILPSYPYLIKPTFKDAYGNAMKSKTASTDQTPIYTIDSSGNLTSFTVYCKAINPLLTPQKFKSEDGQYVAQGTPGYCTEPLSENPDFCKKYEAGDLFISDGNGTLYISKGKSYGKGYRSYIEYTGTEPSASTKTLSLSFSGVEDGEGDGTTTEISVAELADDVIEAFGIKGVYNLNGQKVAETTRNLPAGIYVVNGRKVVVK